MHIRFLFIDETSIILDIDSDMYIHNTYTELRNLYPDKCVNQDIQLIYAGNTVDHSSKVKGTSIREGDTVTVLLKDRSRRVQAESVTHAMCPPDYYLSEADTKALNFVYFVSFVIWTFSYVAYCNHPEYFDSFTVFTLKAFALLWCLALTASFLRSTR